jgi:type I restriction enzyme S subunit
MKGATEKLGNLLVKSEGWIELDPSQEYKEVTVRLWGRGVTLRRIATGSQIGSSRRLRVEPQQFIFSRIDARNGAFGLIPDELGGAVVSNDFPSFTPKSDRLLPEYLGWLSKTHQFVGACRIVSEGTTNRKRLREDRFYDIEIPLPPLPEQRRIVAKIERLAEKIDETRGLSESSRARVTVLREASTIKCFNLKDMSRCVGDCARVVGGFAFKSVYYDESGSHQVLRIGNVRDGFLDLSRAPVRWNLDQNSLRMQKYVLHENDIVISMTGTRNKRDYGYVAIVPPGERLLLNQRVGKVELGGNLDTRYMFHFLRSKFFRDRLFPFATGTANQANIGNRHIEQVPFDPPPLDEQHRIVKYLDGLQAKTDRLKALQAQTAAELDALLPSILDKAFKGEL